MTAAPALSVVVPAFNEEPLLADVTRRLQASLATLGTASEIILVNDGSRDRTGEIADHLARELPGVTAVHQANQGIGGAFRTGAARATGEYVMLWPADMPAEPGDLAPFTGALGQADVIVGVRSSRVGYGPLMHLNSWLYPRLVALLFGLRLRDVNWIHAYRRRRLLEVRLTQAGIPMLAEALVRLRDQGATLLEVDVVMRPRTTGIPSASRPRVMWKTLAGLLRFWRQWRRNPAV